MPCRKRPVGSTPKPRKFIYRFIFCTCDPSATPGVQVKADATDSSGRPAVEISRFEAWSKQEVEAFEDAKTGATLESAWVGPSANYAEDLYLSVTYTNTVPTDPYKS